MMSRLTEMEAVKSAPALVPMMDVKGSGLGLWLARCWPLRASMNDIWHGDCMANEWGQRSRMTTIGPLGTGRKTK